MAQLRLNERVIVITGAGRGLGREYALCLAARGARVVVNDLDDAEGEETNAAQAVVDEIERAGGNAVADTNSVATPDGARALIQTALTAFGCVDALVNNAGVIMHEPIDALTDQAFDATITVNVKGALYATRAAWDHLSASGSGRVVNATSASGLLGVRGSTSYATTKAALVGLTRVLAIEGAELGIRANLIAPLALTRMTTAVTLPGWTPERMHPRLVAPVVAWLCSEECSSNGEILSAGGGRVARYFTSLTTGYFDPELTPETVRDHIDQIRDEADAIVPNSPSDEFDLLMTHFDQSV